MAADFHEDRDSAWLVALADAVAAEMAVDRTEALRRMAIVFGAAGVGTVGSFGAFSREAAVDLQRAALLCERLAAPPAAQEMASAGAPGLFDDGGR